MPLMPIGGERHVRREKAQRGHQNAEQRDARDGLDQVQGLQHRGRSLAARGPGCPAAGRPRSPRRANPRTAGHAVGLAPKTAARDGILAHDGKSSQLPEPSSTPTASPSRPAPAPSRPVRAVPGERVGHQQGQRQHQDPEPAAERHAGIIVALGYQRGRALANGKRQSVRPSTPAPSRWEAAAGWQHTAPTAASRTDSTAPIAGRSALADHAVHPRRSGSP